MSRAPSSGAMFHLAADVPASNQSLTMVVVLLPRSGFAGLAIWMADRNHLQLGMQIGIHRGKFPRKVILDLPDP